MVLTYDTKDSWDRQAVPTQLPYRQSAMLNTVGQLSTIKQYVTGMEWSVDYYNQVIAQDDELMTFDPNAPLTQRQVVLIKNMTIYVTSPLSPENGAGDVNGEATVISGIVPNSGDNFYATAFEYRPSIFEITNVTKKTYNLDNIYDIEYVLKGFVDDDTTLLDALNNSVVKTYYAEKDFFSSRGDRLLLEEKAHLLKKFNKSLESITNYYLSTMINVDLNTIALPGQDDIVVDTMAVEFFMDTSFLNNSYNTHKLNYVTIYDDTHYLKQDNIWKALKDGNIDIIKRSYKKVCLVDIFHVSSDPWLRGIYYLGVDHIVYPKDMDTLLTKKPLPVESAYTISEVENPYRISKDIIPNLVPDIDTEGTNGNYYVFTESFYESDIANMTKLEKVVYDYLNKNEIDTDVVDELLDDCYHMNRLQQYYYIPIILLLIRYSLMGMKSIL